MSSRRNKGPWDPNKSDSEDETFEDRPDRAPSKRRKPHATSSRKTKRPRRNDYGSDSEISESESDGSQEGFSLGSDEDDAVEMNEKGRPVRRVAKAEKSYMESDEDEKDEDDNDDNDDEDDDDEVVKPSSSKSRQKSRRERSPSTRPSLIVKLRTPRATRQTQGGKSIKTVGGEQTIAGSRRSSRISNNQDDALIALTDSGKHEQVMRAGTRSPEPVGRRSARAGKTVTTSVIAEASQENSGEQVQVDEEAIEDDPEMDVDSVDVLVKTDAIEDEDDDEEAAQVIQESQHDPANDDDDDEEEDGPVKAKRTALFPALTEASAATSPEPNSQRTRRSLKRKKGPEESSEYEMNPEEENEEDELSASGDSTSPRKRSRGSGSESGAGRRSQRLSQKKQGTESEESGIDQDELQEELRELKHSNGGGRSRRRRRQSPDIIYDRPKNLRNRTQQVDYRIINPELNPLPEDDDPPAPSNSRRGGGYTRSLFSTLGPFGGAGGPLPMFGGPDDAAGAVGGVDSDSSDDEAVQQRPSGRRDTIGGAVGMTPTAAMNPAQAALAALNSDPAQNNSGGPANLGKVKDRKALADADPLGVDPNVNFSEVGGLDGHINQLKEMVMLPLLYPEVFQRFHTTPPRGVLFHGPPGTGKTLLARALAATVSSQGQKVTFYMRKGADALSKWVGEAERQLRMLFDQARQNQPSIIFFDEIDGLAPVRSSKQDQIHSSIVATLLALMDGMDGRGQVIVIGATNRPDSVDPALRRPGRFDREFYFPLPNVGARRKIIDIHTKGWEPPLEPKFKDQLSQLTKGYGGADLRALCTEAALNAVQGTYPQIYHSEKKLVIDPANIKVLAKDFMISVNKIVPSSGRAASSDAKALDSSVAPLLQKTFEKISSVVDDALPEKKQTTALEEAEYGDRDDERGFEREIMQQTFDLSRIYRPRLLIHGAFGMGQQHIAGALLNKFERLHVQSFDLSVLYGDSTISPEATVIRLFNEVRRHKPSVIYIPNVSTWYESVGPAVVRLFTSQLRSLPPNEPILVLGIMEHDRPTEQNPEGLVEHQEMLKDLFGHSTSNRFMLDRPDEDERFEYFSKVIDMIHMKPTDFPDPATRKKRTWPELPVAPTPAIPIGPTQEQQKEQLKAQKRQDRHTLNLLKIALDPVMNQITRKYRKFRAPVIDQRYYEYLFNERDPNRVGTDVPEEQQDPGLRPYEIRKDEKGVEGLLDVVHGKFYYNLEIVTIEKRLSNGYYKRPKDFLADIKRMVKDARTSGDPERTLRGNELLANVEVDITTISNSNPTLVERCEQVYQREKQREQQMQDSINRTNAENGVILTNLPQPHQLSRTTEPSTGPVILGEPVPGRSALPPVTPQRGVAPPASTEQQPPSNQLTNGSGEHEDVHMTNGEDTSGEQPADKDDADGRPSQPVQKSGFTAMADNTQAADYHNSASSTSSGHKAHNGSHLMSEGSNGLSRDHPDFSMNRQPSGGGSDLPDTQENPPSSSQHSQKPVSQPISEHNSSNSNHSHKERDAASMPPPRQTSSINSLLNTPTDPPPQPSHIVEPDKVSQLQYALSRATSGCSVEQLEALNATIMNAVWKRRAEWNRMRIVRAVEIAFNEKIQDIEHTEGIERSSQEQGQGKGIKLNLGVSI